VEMGVIKPRPSKGKKEKKSSEPIFVEVSRADLVAGYVGQTAPKVNAAVERALGGVLFVDEAYSLKKDGKDAFGQEAVDTLIKEIEDKRDRVIAIFAGYEREMETFFDSNPGFKSRVPFKFYFDDYTCSQLHTIAGIFLSGKGFSASKEADTWLKRTIDFTTGCCEAADCSDAGKRDSGNGRTVRNVLEATYRNFATRVVPSLYANKHMQKVLARAEDFAAKRVSEAPKYEVKYGSSWERYLAKDFGVEAVCDDSSSGGGGKTWGQLCAKAMGQLKEVQGEDVALVAASKAIDLMLLPCREARRSVNELEALAQRALLVVTEDEWEAVVEELLSEDCDGVFDVLGKVPNLPEAPGYDALALMHETAELRPVLAKLQGLVGLQNVKDTMGKLFGLVKLSSWRDGFGMSKLSGQSFHMRFLGNPGTGKTVVARIVGEMLVKMGVVKMPEAMKKELEDAAWLKARADAKAKKKPVPRKPKIELPLVFKEVSRADLVAPNSGQTAPQVQAQVRNATGGVLFIDEAYSIVRGDRDTFGQEAVDTLIKEMEDKREDVIVILAGYEAEMDTFFDANPGFKSRVPLTFRFEDYTCTELAKIGKLNLNKFGMTEGTGVSSPVESLITFATGCCNDVSAPDCHPSRENGNGRTVRNIAEALSRAMATRVMQAHGDQKTEQLPKTDLTTLKPADVQVVAEDQAAVRLEAPCGRNGLLDELSKTVAAPSGLKDWFAQFKLSSPAKQFHKLVRETARVSKSLSAFKSGKLSDLQDQCSQGLEDAKNALRSKATDICGAPDGAQEGQLMKLAAQIKPTRSFTVAEFKETMQSIGVATTEAMLFRKLLRGDLPLQLKDLKPLDKACAKTLKELTSKSIMMPVDEVASMVAGKV